MMRMDPVMRLNDDDFAGEGDHLCRNTCNSTFSVRICSEPGVVCLAWGSIQVFSLVMFFLMSVLGVTCALGGQSVGCVKLCQWTSGILGLICFSIVVSYTTTKSESVYDRHMSIQFGIGMTFVVGWLLGGRWLVWNQRRRSAGWYRAADG